MKPAIYFLILTGIGVLSGCTPKLAESPYGPVENEWMRYVKESYPGWTPPQTFPPARPGLEDEPAQIAPAAVPEENTIIQHTELIIEEPVVAEPLAPIVPVTPEAGTAVTPPVIQPAVVPAVAEEKFEIYEVQKGDSLSLIAQKVYGKSKLWPRIADFNNITDPRKLKAGMKIKIPVEK